MTTSLVTPSVSAADFPIGRRVVVGLPGQVIGANGTTSVDSIAGDVVTLKIGKAGQQLVRISRVLSVGLFPEVDLVGSRAQAPR